MKVGFVAIIFLVQHTDWETYLNLKSSQDPNNYKDTHGSVFQEQLQNTS